MPKAKSKVTAPVARSATTRAPATVAGVATKTVGRVSKTAAEALSRRTSLVETEFTAPDGSIDINTLVDLLAARLSPPSATGLGQLSGGTGETNAASRRTDLSQGPSVGSGLVLKNQNPIDTEFNLIAGELDALHAAVTDLNGLLEPVLSHQELTEGKEEANVGRSSESPLHRRLIDLHERLQNATQRVRYTISRVRN